MEHLPASGSITSRSEAEALGITVLGGEGALPAFVPPPEGALLTVVGSFYHQGSGQQPTSQDIRYSRQLRSNEQAYIRNTKIGEDWQPLDFGWVKVPGFFVLTNNEGKFTGAQPTDRERQEARTHIIEFGIVSELLSQGLTKPKGRDMFSEPLCPEQPVLLSFILPGEALSWSPATDPAQLRIRCRKGTARYTLWAVQG
jgi:hypothetical protein